MKPKSTLRPLLAALGSSLLTLSTASAADFYWNTTTTGLWSNGVNWSDNATTGGTTGTVPGSGDTATFHQSDINGATIVEFDAAAPISGLTFRNTGTTLLRSNSTTARSLTIGAGGITINSETGAVTLGGSNPLNLSLSAAQGWTNSSASLFTVVNGVANGGNLLTIGGTGNTTVSGAISGTGGLTKVDGGTLTLNTAANTHTGGTTVNGGKLLLGYFGGANGVGTIRGTLTVNAGATVDYSVANALGYNTSGGSVNVLNIVGGTVGGSNFVNHFWNNFQLNMTGGTLHLGGTTNEFLNPTVTVNSSAETARILRVVGSSAVMRLRDGTSGTFNVADGAQAVDLLIDLPIIDNAPSNITKTGAGTMALTAANTYTGNTTVSAGTLTFSGSGTIYNATNTATVSVASGAQIVASATTNNVLGFGSGATWNVAGTINSSGGGAQTLPATVNLNNGTLTGVANNTFGAFLTNAAYTTTLTANGANNLISSANFGMSNSSTLALNTPLATDALSVTAPLGLAGQTGSLTKSGLGTVTLSGANIYTGATNVNNGTLIIDGSTSSTSIVTVASGATLGGSGTLGGNTTISGTLAPGNSIDKLGLNSDLTFNAGSVFAWELAPDIVGNTVGTRATHYDAVNVGGTLGGSGGIFRAVLTTGSFADAFWTSNRSWTDIFMNTAETSSVNYASIFTAMEYWQGETNVTDTIGSYGSFGISGSTLTWTAVPEPSTALVSLLLTAGLLRRRRK